MKTHPPSHRSTTFPCSRRDCTRVLAIALAVMPVSRAQIFAAPGEAPPPGAIAAARAKKTAGEIRTFTLRLNYAGQKDKPFYRLLLSVPAIVGKDSP
ncbi:MAG: hypothetical protein NTV08_10240 [Verrucomicrobia bacterium]|nr:hypothetical protein [Verrucomicrobiota bacterium]